VRRDAIFYQIFKRFPSLLFTLVDQPPEQAQRYRFESVEVKEPSFRIDGVFLPPDDDAAKTVFFAEVQFQTDDDLYHRFFCESFLYLYRNRILYPDWYGVVIFASRNLEPENTTIHRTLLNSPQVQRIYLDELGDPNQQPVGISLIQLTTAPEAQMPDQARQLIERVEQAPISILSKTDIVDIITTIAVYKFTNLSREEVETMLGQSLEETRFYQEVKAEGERIGEHDTKVKMISKLLSRGLSIEEIAEIVELSIEEVRQIIPAHS
jgi:predicted transposase/invertase (TIGR01784 family)